MVNMWSIVAVGFVLDCPRLQLKSKASSILRYFVVDSGQLQPEFMPFEAELLQPWRKSPQEARLWLIFAFVRFEHVLPQLFDDLPHAFADVRSHQINRECLKATKRRYGSARYGVHVDLEFDCIAVHQVMAF